MDNVNHNVDNVDSNVDSVIQPQEIVEANGLSGIVRTIPKLSSADIVNLNVDSVKMTWTTRIPTWIACILTWIT